MNAITRSILLPALTALPSTRILTVLACAALVVLSRPASADTFGSGANTFTIDFVSIGNAGNADDSGGGGGSSSSPYGGVKYEYRMATYEISQVQIDKATASGLMNVTAGAWTGSQPAANIEWYEAAAFVNWLNTSAGCHAAYNLTWTGSVWTMNLWSAAEAWDNDPGAGADLNRYRHKDACYFLPSEDEWYKAAYHKNDGVTANYWDYATGSNNLPDGIDYPGDTEFEAVFEDPAANQQPNAVTNVGVASPSATFGQNGNIYEWQESAFTAPNDDPSEARAARGGRWFLSTGDLASSVRDPLAPASSFTGIGFRVASTLSDVDGDGIPDRFETGTGIYVSLQNTGTNPTNFDTDGDGLYDGQEVGTYHSNPNIKDTDADGFEDGFEVSTGFSPTSAASTPDALSSARAAVEYRFNAANGVSYRVEASTDLANWATIETPIIGAGGVITRFYSVEGQPRRFFRSRRN